MSVIEVRAPGMLTTVQDLGREGFGPMGVSASGAADPVALRIGNRLVDNAEGAAGLEMTLLGGTFIFPGRAVVALTGVDFSATLDDQPVELWSSAEVQPGQTLRLGPTRGGARCYLCVRGGIDVKLFLGSASTHLLSGLGGIEGRALRKGDVLKIGTAGGGFRTFRKRNVARRALEKLLPRKVLRVHFFGLCWFLSGLWGFSCDFGPESPSFSAAGLPQRGPWAFWAWAWQSFR